MVAYEFEPFRLEPATRRLLCNGEPLSLAPKAFDTLLVLVQHRDRVVEKSEALRLVWPDTVVARCRTRVALRRGRRRPPLPPPPRGGPPAGPPRPLSPP